MLNSAAYQAIIEDPLWTSIGVGHWTGGSQGNTYGCLFKYPPSLGLPRRCRSQQSRTMKCGFCDTEYPPST